MITKKYTFITILGIVFFISGCRVTLIPPYEEQLADQIESAAKKIDYFYLVMQETTVNQNGGRAYSNFAEQYAGIEAELNSLFYKNKIRPLNENSTRICEITLQTWKKYKDEHKSDNEISNGLIELNRLAFNNLFYAMQVAEKAKDIINKSPN